jgi:hypothetical protein
MQPSLILTPSSGLLELLLDMNNSPNLPSHQRVDLSAIASNASLAPLPSLFPPTPSPSPDQQGITRGQESYNKLHAYMHTSMTEKRSSAPHPQKSLASLMATVPHRPYEVTAVPPSVYNVPGVPPEMARDLQIGPDKPEPVAYLSVDRIDEHCALIDGSLDLPSEPTLYTSNPNFVPAPLHLSDKDLEFKNPVSVYNWLREHEPKIFLQDGEPASLAEKAISRPGALRGAGKRAAIPAPSRPDTVEFVEEDGMGYDVSMSGGPNAKDKTPAGGKRKRTATDEDGGYRPKGGSSRPTKKKRGEGRASTGSRKEREKTEKADDVDMGEDILAVE